MTHEQKLEWIFEDLSRRGIKRGSFAPLLHRLLWRFGFPIRPPHFTSFGGNFCLGGLFMGLAYFIARQGSNAPLEGIIVGSVACGAVGGLFTALSYSRQARKFSLPKWEECPMQPPSDLAQHSSRQS
jgi:hypothetical protein